MLSDCVIDAHCLLWFFEGNSKLGSQARILMADPQSRIIIPAIALAEAFRVIEDGKSKIPAESELSSAIGSDRRMRIDPIDGDLVERSSALRAVREMHDRLIVAAALRVQLHSSSAVLLTADHKIRASGLTNTAW